MDNLKIFIHFFLFELINIIREIVFMKEDKNREVLKKLFVPSFCFYSS